MPGCSGDMSGGGGQDQISYNASQSSPSFARVAVGGRKRRGGMMMYGGDGLTTLASNHVAGRRRSRRVRRGGLLTSTGIKPLMTPATLGSTGSVDTDKASFGPTPTRKAGRKVRKGRKTRRHRK
jgi:hypothetical protein